jgi:AcrR family transcriptional regulator
MPRVNDIQRARLLTAMIEVAGELGAANVTVADVVRCSGVSRRTFYELFSNREDCFTAALDAALERVTSTVEQVYRQHDRWRDRIRAGLVELLCLFDEEPCVGHLLVVQTLGAGQPALVRRQQTMSGLVGAIDEGRAEAKSEVPELTAEGLVGAVFAVVHARMLDEQRQPLVGLTNELMSMIVLPYKGAAAARRELRCPTPEVRAPANAGLTVLRDLDLRLTYRTVRVLLAVGAHPGASNRRVAQEAEIPDQGQMSKLLRRLEDFGLICNAEEDRAQGEANAWWLTERGAAVRGAISPDALAQ